RLSCSLPSAAMLDSPQLTVRKLALAHRPRRGNVSATFWPPRRNGAAGHSLRHPRMEGVVMAYELEGKLLEVCTCNVLCPCWVGEDPDGGTCTGALSWHIETGTVNGTDVTGRTLSILTFIPGNILEGNWK